MPRISQDDYIDFCVVEAMVARANEEEAEAQEDGERARFRSKESREAWAKQQGLA